MSNKNLNPVTVADLIAHLSKMDPTLEVEVGGELWSEDDTGKMVALPVNKPAYLQWLTLPTVEVDEDGNTRCVLWRQI